jgi:GGDEF domain-containing protein
MSGFLKKLGESAENSASKGRAVEADWTGNIETLRKEALARVKPGSSRRAAPASPVTTAMKGKLRQIHAPSTKPKEGINPRREAQRDLAAAQRKIAYADSMDAQPREFEYFADLDKLKGFNDTFGMPYGDAYIEAAERSLRNQLGKVPEANPLFTRAAGDEFYVSGDDSSMIESALQRVSRDLNRGVTIDRGPLGKHTVAGVGSLKYGKGRNLDEADAALRSDKTKWSEIDQRTGRRHGDARSDMSGAQHLYEYEDPELDWQHIGFKRGGLATIGNYLAAYEAGERPRDAMTLADQYPDAFEGEYEDGDEFLGEDDEYEYYACGGQVQHFFLGGIGKKLKKGIKKVGKVAGKIANAPGKALSKIPGVKSIAKVVAKAAPALGFIPGVGTVAGGLIGGIAGNIASGGKTSGFLRGALSGASGGVGGGIAGSVASKLGGGTLAKLAGTALGDIASGAMQRAGAKLLKDPSGKSLTPEELQAVQSQQAQRAQATLPQPASIGTMNNAADQRTSALQAVSQAPANQFAQNYQPAPPAPVVPGSNSQGLLSMIKQQQAARAA